MEAKIYNRKGEEAGKIKLPEEIFGLAWNGDLVHQVVTSMQTNSREPWAHTKDRGEVAGGGKKPWRQKGTGRARHGSIRSPLWVGGGITHGPNNKKNFSRKVNDKMKAKALFTILSKKAKDGEIVFIDTLAFETPKTKEARTAIEKLGAVKGFERLMVKKTNSALVAVSEKDKNAEKSFRNLPGIGIEELRNMNPLTVLGFKYLIISEPKDSIAFLSAKISKK